MITTKLIDGTEIFCLRKPEAKMLDHHVEGYMQHGISINDGDVVFDVGANIGVFGVRAVQKFSNVKVFAFEPIPEIYEVLKTNAEKFGKGRFFALKYGASDANGTTSFSYFPNTPALSTSHPEMWDENPDAFENAVKGSMKNAPADMQWMKWLPTSLAGLVARFLRSGKQMITCELRTISSVIEEYKIEKIDLLKIDCEGAELSAIKGIKEEDWKKINKVVVEVHDMENRVEFISDLLRRHGLTKIVKEKEKALEETALYNVYATR